MKKAAILCFLFAATAALAGGDPGKTVNIACDGIPTAVAEGIKVKCGPCTTCPSPCPECPECTCNPAPSVVVEKKVPGPERVIKEVVRIPTPVAPPLQWGFYGLVGGLDTDAETKSCCWGKCETSYGRNDALTLDAGVTFDLTRRWAIMGGLSHVQGYGSGVKAGLAIRFDR
jgi:hypothetical protein